MALIGGILRLSHIEQCWHWSMEPGNEVNSPTLIFYEDDHDDVLFVWGWSWSWIICKKFKITLVAIWIDKQVLDVYFSNYLNNIQADACRPLGRLCAVIMLVCWDPVGTLGARPTECFISWWFTVNAPGTRIHPVECCTLKDGKTRKCRTKDRERKDPKIVLISPFTSSSDISVNSFKAVLFQRLVFFANMGNAFFAQFSTLFFNPFV